MFVFTHRVRAPDHFSECVVTACVERRGVMREVQDRRTKTLVRKAWATTCVDGRDGLPRPCMRERGVAKRRGDFGIGKMPKLWSLIVKSFEGNMVLTHSWTSSVHMFEQSVACLLCVVELACVLERKSGHTRKFDGAGRRDECPHHASNKHRKSLSVHVFNTVAQLLGSAVSCLTLANSIE